MLAQAWQEVAEEQEIKIIDLEAENAQLRNLLAAADAQQHGGGAQLHGPLLPADGAAALPGAAQALNGVAAPQQQDPHPEAAGAPALDGDAAAHEQDPPALPAGAALLAGGGQALEALEEEDELPQEHEQLHQVPLRFLSYLAHQIMLIFDQHVLRLTLCF